jgi:ketosteroid isomerase-like protein
MSQENVELAHRAFDALNRRDLGAFLALMDDDVEAVPRLVAMEGGYHGHDGIRRWWQNLLDAFPDYSVEIVEVRDLGDLTFIALRNRGHGAGSDAPIEHRLWMLAEWRQEKVVWWRSYGTEAEALEAVGLRE